MVGGSLSLTVTVCSHGVTLPDGSVAVQVNVVVPTGYGSTKQSRPSLRSHITLHAQLSVQGAGPGSTIAEHLPSSAGVTMSSGHVMVGGSLSRTVTFCRHGLLLLPEGSVAVHVSVVFPTG